MGRRRKKDRERLYTVFQQATKQPSLILPGDETLQRLIQMCTEICPLPDIQRQISKLNDLPKEELWLFLRQRVLNSCNEYGWTILHQACEPTSPDSAVETLLEAGSEPNIKDDWGRQPLHLASYHGTLPKVRLLLANGAVPEPKDQEGKTPLYWAAHRGHQSVVEHFSRFAPSYEALKDAERAAQANRHRQVTAVVQNLLSDYRALTPQSL